MDTREEVKQALVVETNWLNHFSERLKKYADRGEREKAITSTDQLKVAYQCLSDRHTEFWEVSGEQLTDEEFELVSGAEVAMHKALTILRQFKEQKNEY